MEKYHTMQFYPLKLQKLKASFTFSVSWFFFFFLENYSVELEVMFQWPVNDQELFAGLGSAMGVGGGGVINAGDILPKVADDGPLT